VTFFVEYEEERSRLTTFFRIFTALPHLIFLMVYGIAAFFAVIGAWFALVFTAKYPEGIYNFLEAYNRYVARVYSYMYLATDTFPPFSGNPEEPYNAHFQIGPPLEKYSRWKAFFRGILIIPFYVVAYVLTLVYEIAAVIAWFAIVITGKQPKGLQDALIFGLSYVIRLNPYYMLLTEAWPTQFTDEAVGEQLAGLGYTAWPPVAGAPAIAAPAAPPEPPAPPAPPAV
jgi:hypothetical protein